MNIDPTKFRNPTAKELADVLNAVRNTFYRPADRDIDVDDEWQIFCLELMAYRLQQAA